jgi:hypothetical protein
LTIIEAEAERERLAAEAFDRIRSGNHWRDWTYVAQGFEVGRNRAMREAHTNEPVGRGYNTAFARWMDRTPWARKIDKATRNHCLWIADHLVEIEAWRETLAANQRDAWNHPTTVRRAYERAQRAAVARDQGEPVLSPMAALKAELVKVQEECDQWRRRAKEGGSLFDLHKDSAEGIGQLIADECSPTRAAKIARTILAKLKEKQVHAG